MQDGREYLPAGTQVKLLDTGTAYEIIDDPVAYGGGSILYRVRRLYIDKTGESRTDALEYVLKECYPVAEGRFFLRNSAGEIVPEDEDDLEFLNRIKSFQVHEERISKKLYNTSSRMVPIRECSQLVELIYPGKRRPEIVRNTVSIMDCMVEKGRSLAHWLEADRLFTLVEALRIVRELLAAVEEIHNSAYLHLDLQPGNILLSEQKQVSLIDFGCARLMNKGKTEPITDKVVLTTKGFTAPEILIQNRGSLQLGPEADIFSCGSILLLLLTGFVPDVWDIVSDWNGKYAARQIARIIRRNKGKIPPHLRDSLERFLMQSVAPNPHNRYQSAQAMRNDVESLLVALEMTKKTPLAAVKYDVYIAYTHRGSLDRRAALTLQKALESYIAPKGVSEKRRPFGKVFLDTGELSSADLETQLREALRNTKSLIVVCSEKTPESPWVNKEINIFLEEHQNDRSRISALLIDGTSKTAFPPQLKADEENGDGEIFAASAFSKRPREMARKIRSDEVLLRLVAPILNTTFETLHQRRKLENLKKYATIISVGLVVALSFAAYAANRANVIAKQNRQIMINESLILSEQAEKRLENDPHGAIELCLQALPDADVDRPVVTDAEYVLARAMNIYSTPGSSQGSISATGTIFTDMDSFTLDASGEYLLVWDSVLPRGIQVWNTAGSLKMIQHLYQNSNVSVEPCGLIGNKLIVRIGTEIACVEYLTGKENWRIQTADLLSVHLLKEKKQIILFSEMGDYLQVTSISEAEGSVLHSQNYSVPMQLGEKIWISQNSEWVAFYSEDGLQILNLSDGRYICLDKLDTNIDALEIIGDVLYVIRSKGFSGTTYQEKVELTVVEKAEVVFEIYSLEKGECLFSHTKYRFSDGGISRVIPLGEKIAFLWFNYCILVEEHSGEVLAEYMLLSGVVDIMLDEKGFTTVNADGTVSTAVFPDSEQTESIMTRVLFKSARNAVRKDNVFYIQDEQNIIRRFEEGKYDDLYNPIWTSNEAELRIVETCRVGEKTCVVMVTPNEVCCVDTEGNEFVFTVPAEYGLSSFTDAWVEKDILYWVYSENCYSVNLLHGTVVADGKPASVQRSLSSEDGVQICDPSGSPLLLWSKDNVITRCDGTSQLDMKQHNTLTLFSTSPGEGKWIWIDPKTLLLMTEHQSFLLDVSGEDLKIRSTIDHCLGYESGKDCFIVGDMQQKSATLGLIPRYSVEMLVEKGQVILGK